MPSFTTRDYSYLEDLVLYLESFILRSSPLFDLEGSQFQQKFESKWASGDFEEWTLGLNASKNENGGERNKLYCQACQKEFAKDTVYEAHLKGKAQLYRPCQT